ncbi:molybdopterin binding oxidoreductase [Obba rivulosa]|uniref:Molybdopterin binding oxidoreductase n=1 Tax=Obba rivulosa TaxID=1052685 RepID=A0A8E2DTE3_9APHY|nr:molybdopterin binding oxidoreductase [Obba rivulosa]
MDFSNEPQHSVQLIARAEKPWNAEPELDKLVQHNITPEELVYCRNHSPIKPLGEDLTVKIDGLVQNKLQLTTKELKDKFERREVVAALQCAGNRRKTMVEKKHKDVDGIKWEEATICNVRWGGVSVRDVLLHAGITSPNAKANGIQSPTSQLHLCFASHVTACEEDDWFGASIPLEKAMDDNGGVLLAFEMNGKPLSPDHGFPLRAVIPGYSGVRWVKWVDRITVSEGESENFYQQKDYKVLPPQVEKHDQANREDWWSKVPALQAMPLNSAIAIARIVAPRVLYVKGYAISGETGQVARVDVSIDEGKSWQPARITYQEGRWSWTLWEATIALPEGHPERGKVWSRAVDERGEMQRLDVDWNLRGVAYTAVGEREFQ